MRVSVFPLVLVLVSSVFLIPSFTAPSYAQSAGSNHTRSFSNALSASGYWLSESQDGLVSEEFFLTAIKSKQGIDAYVTETLSDYANNNFNHLSGHVFVSEPSELEISNKLNSAILHPVSINICITPDQDVEGKCVEDAPSSQTINISVQWTATSDKLVQDSRSFALIDTNKFVDIFNGAFRDAAATLTVDGESLGESEFADLRTAKSLEVTTVTSNESPNFGALGNKGLLVANAFWDDVTINGESAGVFLTATKDASDGDSVITLEIVLHESGQFLSGHLSIPTSSKKDSGPFFIDRTLEDVHLEPVTITVCSLDIGQDDCSSPEAQEKANFTIEAKWKADGATIITRDLEKFMQGTFKEMESRAGISIISTAAGTIAEQELGESKISFLLHFI